MAKLIAIAKKHKKRAPMETLIQANISKESGVEGDFRGKPGRRQVTVLSLSAWQAACEETNFAYDWTVRRANLLVDSLNFIDSVGKKIIIGELELLITQETDPCRRMKEVDERLYDALANEWRGGVCCRVIKEGQIAVGDNVKLEEV